MSMKYLHLIVTLLGATGITLLSSTFSADAASVSFSASEQRGSDDVDVDIFAKDVTGGIELTFTVNDLINTADLRAGYINFVDSFNISNITNVVGALSFDTNTRNVGNSGNIGQIFDLGFELTGPGAAGGLVTTKTVSILGTDLNIADILGQQAAVRLQAVGSNPINGGNGSARQFGTVSNSHTEPVPEPLTILGTVVAAGMGGLFKHAKKKSIS